MISFWPQTIENRAALKTAIAALVAVLISFLFHLDTPYWSGMTVVVVANLYTGSIIDKAVMRIIGTIAGAFLGFYIAGIVANSILLYFLSCFLIIAMSVYYYNFSNYSYAYLLGALCAFIVISQLAINPQNAFFVAIWRPVEIGIGVLVSAVSAYVIFPNHIKDDVLLQLHDIFNDFSKEFQQMLECLLQDKSNLDEIAPSNLKIKRKIRKAEELVGVMHRESGITQDRITELHVFLNVLYEISRQLQYLIIISAQQNDLGSLQSQSIEPVFKAIQGDIEQFQSVLSNSVNSPILLQTSIAVEALDIKFKYSRKKSKEKNDLIYSFIHFIKQVNEGFIKIQSLLTHTLVIPQSKFQLLDKQERLRSDPDLIKHGIKAGLAVILALSFWLITKWPGGLNGIISSLIISIRKNLYDMKNISVHRVIGCFKPGGAALGSLFLFEINLYDFVLVMFFSVWGFTYFMFKYPQYAYIGLQANIALIITLAQQGGPPVLLDPPLQRLGGILIGIVASFLVANVVWRSDAITVLSRYLSKLNTYLIYNIEQVLLVPDCQKSLHDLASLFWTTRDLTEGLAGESLNLKKRKKITQLSVQFESLVVINAILSHILVTIDRKKAHSMAEKMGLNLQLYEKNLVVLYQHHDRDGGLLFNKELQTLILDIENNPEHLKAEPSELRNLLAYVNTLSQLSLSIQ